jgi:hypothetical protein
MPKRKLNRWTKILMIGGIAVFLFVGLNWAYVMIVTRWAIQQGAYPTAEEGMIQRANAYYEGMEKIEIKYAGPNSFDGSQPHVWYVIARIWAERKQGRPVGSPGKDYETPGGFYLETTQGWVQIPEGMFPRYLGLLMDVFGLAGPGSTTPTTNHTDW